MLRRSVLGVVIAIVAAACGGNSEEVEAPPSTATTSAPVSATTEAAAPTTGAPDTSTAPTEINAFSEWIDAVAAPGECMNVAYNDAGDDADFAVAPEIIDCDEPHDHQVVSIGEYPAATEAPYPDIDTFYSVVFDDLCAEAFDAALGAPILDTSLAAWAFWPDQDAWSAGDRTTACSITNLDNPIDGSALVGPMSGAGLVLPDHRMAAIAEFDEVDLWIYTFGADGEVADLVNVTDDGNQLIEELTPPSWSPDLSKIVYAAHTADGENEIYLLEVASGTKTNLTNHPANDGGPVFSPDGTRILFASDRADDDLDLFVMDLDGSNVIQLTATPDRESSPDWSPDGSQIVFRKRVDGQSDIWIMNADGSDQRFFRGGVDGEYDPDWSPDGSRILFITDGTEEGTYEILVAPVDGEGSTNLTNHPANDEYPEWSPDGRHIVFNSDRHGYAGLFIMNADGSDQSALVWSYPVGFAQLALP